MLDFSHTPNTANGAESFIFNALGANDWQTWLKPRGKSHCNIIVIGAGAGGGGGFSGAAAAARSGGGGGGSASITRLTNIPLFTLPDALFLNIGMGGTGGAAGAAGLAGGLSFVCVRPDATLLQNRLVTTGVSAPTGGGGGSASAGGAAGAASSTSAPPALASLAGFSTIIGGAGSVGGAAAGGIGLANLWGAAGTANLSGGAGGGGTTSADFAGGAITGGGWFPTIAGGLAGSNRGQDGFYSTAPLRFLWGLGGWRIQHRCGRCWWRWCHWLRRRRWRWWHHRRQRRCGWCWSCDHHMLVNSTMTSIEREIGNLEARMQTVESELQAIRSDVREIRDALVGAKGGWRMLILVIGLATTCGAVLGRFLPLLLNSHP